MLWLARFLPPPHGGPALASRCTLAARNQSALSLWCKTQSWIDSSRCGSNVPRWAALPWGLTTAAIPGNSAFTTIPLLPDELNCPPVVPPVFSLSLLAIPTTLFAQQPVKPTASAYPASACQNAPVVFTGSALRPLGGNDASPARETAPSGFAYKVPISFSLTTTLKR